MPRSMWKGTISFGMVSIPVKLYAATESKSPSFHQLHKECNARVQHRLWCPVCDRALDRSEVVRGYEYAKGQYVHLTEDELEDLPVPSKDTIELAAFVKRSEVDPVHHDRSYWIEPEPAGVKPYALLTQVLRESGYTGMASVAMRNRERLCGLRSMDGGLVLDTLLYPDEVRLAERPKVPDVLVSDREKAVAKDLVEALAEPFDPHRYEDRYREALLELVQRKVDGREGRAAPGPKEEATTPTDLMAALRASVEALRKSGTTGDGKKGRRKAA